MNNSGQIKLWHILLIIFIILAILFAVFSERILKKEPAVNQLLVNQNNSTENNLLANSTSNSKDFFGKMQLIKNDEQPDILKLDILLDTENTNIVLAAAKIIYDPQVFELQKTNQDNSVLDMSIMTEEKIPGEVLIMRGAPGDKNYSDIDDGFTGSTGQLASLEFKVLNPDTTQITFDTTESQMIVDDGQGTLMQLEFENFNYTN